MKRAILLLSLFVASCATKPVAEIPTNNSDLKIDYLGQFDDCRVYRFLDSHYVYFVRCSNDPVFTTTEFTEQNGKVRQTVRVESQVNP